MVGGPVDHRQGGVMMFAPHTYRLFLAAALTGVSASRPRRKYSTGEVTPAVEARWHLSIT